LVVFALGSGAAWAQPDEGVRGDLGERVPVRTFQGKLRLEDPYEAKLDTWQEIDSARRWQTVLEAVAAADPAEADRLRQAMDPSRDHLVVFVGGRPDLRGARRIGENVSLFFDVAHAVPLLTQGERSFGVAAVSRDAGAAFHAINYRGYHVDGAAWEAAGIVRSEAGRPVLVSPDGTTYTFSRAYRDRDWIYDLLSELDGRPLTIGGVLRGGGDRYDFWAAWNPIEPREHELGRWATATAVSASSLGRAGGAQLLVPGEPTPLPVYPEGRGDLVAPFVDAGLPISVRASWFVYSDPSQSGIRVDQVRANTLSPYEDLPQGAEVELLEVRGDQALVRATGRSMPEPITRLPGRASPDAAARQLPLWVLLEARDQSAFAVTLERESLAGSHPPGGRLEVRVGVQAPAGVQPRSVRLYQLRPDGVEVGELSLSSAMFRLSESGEGTFRGRLRIDDEADPGSWVVRAEVRFGAASLSDAAPFTVAGSEAAAPAESAGRRGLVHRIPGG
jgi:hypothetical protein